jgi:CPA1 family monovalent cation:H+ antiporter
LILYGILVSLIVIVARVIWVYPVAYLSRLIPSVARKDPIPSWQPLFILSWSGMRGIVSLAAALSVPRFLPSGVAFPHRDLIIFITYCVIVVTLIIPTLTLPFLLKYFKLDNPEDVMRQEAIARIRSLEGAVDRLNKFVKAEKIPENIFNEFMHQIERRLKVINTQLNLHPFSTLNDEYMALKKLVLAAIETERQTLINLRKSGEVHDTVFHMLSDELDLEEMRAGTLRL